jgi:hypothetical protein
MTGVLGAMIPLPVESELELEVEATGIWETVVHVFPELHTFKF